MKSQTDKILKFLSEGRIITKEIALRKFNCTRLSARIYDLRKLGHKIATESLVSKDGEVMYFYKMKGKRK